jgi:hypothetical protein
LTFVDLTLLESTSLDFTFLSFQSGLKLDITNSLNSFLSFLFFSVISSSSYPPLATNENTLIHPI